MTTILTTPFIFSIFYVQIVSPGARDLIGRLLVKDQSKRMRLGDLPKHPWIQHHIANRGPTAPSNSSQSQGQGMNR